MKPQILPATQVLLIFVADGLAQHQKKYGVCIIHVE